MARGKKQAAVEEHNPPKVDKKIKKGKVASPPASPPASPVKKVRKGEKQSKKAPVSKFNQLFYPEQATLHFPNQLQDSLFRIIASFKNNASLDDIIRNLPLFYENEIAANIVHNFIAEAEESGIIFERDQFYSVTQELLPEEPKAKEVEVENEAKRDYQFEDEPILPIASEKKENIIEQEIDGGLFGAEDNF